MHDGPQGGDEDWLKAPASAADTAKVEYDQHSVQRPSNVAFVALWMPSTAGITRVNKAGPVRTGAEAPFRFDLGRPASTKGVW
jgi:hypothetical protein